MTSRNICIGAINPMWMGMYGLKYDMFTIIIECIYTLILQEYTGYLDKLCIVNCGNLVDK